MAVAGVLEIQMRADIARLQKDMEKMKSTVKKSTKAAAESVDILKKALKLLAVAFSVKVIVGWAKNVLEAQDAMLKLSEKVGIGVEALVGWQHVAERSGADVAKFTDGIKTLSEKMLDAQLGSTDMINTFKALRVEFQTSDGQMRNSEVVMLEVADAFERMEDGGKKVAIANKLMGGAGLEMIPALNMGADAIRELMEEGKLLNPVTQESARNAAEFRDNLDNLTNSLTVGFQNALQDVLPVLIFLTDELFNARKESLGLSGSMSPLSQGLIGVADAGSEAVLWLTGLHITLQGMKEVFRATLEEGVEGATAARNRVEKLMNEHEQFVINRRLRFQGALDKTPSDLITEEDIKRNKRRRDQADFPTIEFNKPTTKGGQTPAEKAEEAAGKYLVQLQKITEAESLQTEVGKAMWAMRFGSLKGTTDQQRDWIIEKAKAIDLEKAHAEAAQVMKTMMEESALQQQEAMQETLRINEAMKENDIAKRDRLIDRWQNEKETIEDQRDEELDLLEELWEKKLLSENNYLEMRLRMIEEFDEKRERADERSMTQSEKFTASSWQKKTQTIFGELSNLSAGVSTHSRKMFELNKVAGISEAGINAYTGISKTLAAYPYPINVGMAAAHAIAAFAQINAIQSATFQGGGAGAAPSLAGSTPAPPVSPVGGQQGNAQTTIINFKGTTNEKKMMRRFVETLNDNTHDGGRLLYQ